MRQKVYNSTTSTWEYVDSSPPVDTGVVQSSTTAKLTTGPTAPASPAEGDVWVDTNSSMLKLSETAVGIGKDPENGALDVDGDIYSNGEKVSTYQPLNYSTSEQNTGQKWIDGKPIYVKTIDIGPLPNNTVKHVAHDISALGHTVRLEGSAYAPGKTQIMPLPFVNTGVLGYGVALQATTTSITTETGFNRSTFTIAYATIYYTKTTD